MERSAKIGEIYINSLKTVCFTGHRPEKIPFDTKDKVQLDMLKSVLYLHALDAVRNRGYDTFLCGMQRGIDIWAGQQILRLKAAYPNVRLICISPFRREIDSRRGTDSFDYCELRDGCDGFMTLGESYVNGCYQARNRFMVEHSSMIIGAIADRKSGSGQTLSYARRQGLLVEEINLAKFAEDYALHE